MDNDRRAYLALLVERRPLTSFVVLAFVFALIPFLLMPGAMMVRAILAGLAPLFAALAVLAVTEGKPGVHSLLAGFLKWRFDGKLYLLVLAFPCLIVFGAWLGLTLFGVQADFLVPWTPGIAFVVLVSLLRGPVGEEAGFRGFALPLLMRRYSLIPASLAAGGLSALWRLPFVVMVGMGLFAEEPEGLVLFLAATSLGTVILAVPLGWLYVNTGSLVAPAILRLGVGLGFLFLIAPDDVKALGLAVSMAVIIALWLGAIRIPRPKSAAGRPPLTAGVFSAFQGVAVVSLLPWFFFYVLFNINNPVAERDVAFIIQFLFGTLWHLPVFLGLVSAFMWLAWFQRRRRTAFAAGITLCMPLATFALILLSQYLEYMRMTS